MDNSSKSGSLPTVAGSMDVLYPETVTSGVDDWCWTRRSRLERKLVVVVGVCGVAAVLLLCVVLVLATQRDRETLTGVTTETPTAPAVCMTSSCVQVAGRILEKMSSSVDPCENFYDYACGEWVEKAVIPSNKRQIVSLSSLQDTLMQNLKVLLERRSPEDELKSITEAKNMYKSCVDLGTIDGKGRQPALDWLADFGDWPLLQSNWNESGFNLESLLIKASTYNDVPLIFLIVEADIAHTDVRKIYFDQPYLGMDSRLSYLGDRNASGLMAYQNYVTRTAVALGADPVRAEVQVREIIDFEIQLARITMREEDRQDYRMLYNPRNLTQMAQDYPQFDWLKYVRGTVTAQGGVEVGEEEVVINWSPPYYEKLFPLVEATSKRVVANYVVWMLLQQRVKLLDSTFREDYKKYAKDLLGVSLDVPRWKVCTKYVNDVMDAAVGRLYVDEYFKEEAKTDLVTMVSYLKDAFYEMMDDVEWMEEATKEAAKEKLQVMGHKIGYPDYLKNNSHLDDYYKGYTFSPSQYFENFLLEKQHSSRRSLSKLRKPVDDDQWLAKTAVVNGFYNSGSNQIVFPAGILQPPMYSKDQPSSLKFGAIGSVIGHEMTHGFDDEGRTRDRNGNFRQWWKQEDIDKFRNATKCFINATSSFFVPEARMFAKGQRTLSEDIADSGGVKQSFRAYRKWASEREEEPLLPGLPLSHDQLFFLSWSQLWCTKIRPEYAVMSIYRDIHSPNSLRAVQALQNLPDFAEVFGCKPSTPMNPDIRCKIW